VILGGEKDFEDARLEFGRDAAAVVFDGDFDEVVGFAGVQTMLPCSPICSMAL